MISQVNSAMVRNAYAGNIGEGKEVSQKEKMGVSKQGDTSKVDQIKEAIESGQYKINLHTLSQKIAEALL